MNDTLVGFYELLAENPMQSVVYALLSVWLGNAVVCWLQRLRRKRDWKKRLFLKGIKLYNIEQLAVPDTKVLEDVQENRYNLWKSGTSLVSTTPSDDFPLDLLGSGTAGNVYLRQDHDQSFMAMKIFRCPDEHHLNNALVEIKMHHNVTKCSDTIVQVIGYGYELNQNADTVESLALVMEYCPGGNLEEYIELQKDKGPIEEKQILNWLYDLSDALTKMHEAGVIIADLKSANIALSRNNQVRILDFGAATEMIPPYSSVKGFFGTQEYDAPEIIEQQCDTMSIVFTHKVDVWALGCVMFELMTGKLLDYTLSDVYLAETMSKVPRLYSKYAKTLLEWLLDANPDTRASTNEIMHYLARDQQSPKYDNDFMSCENLRFATISPSPVKSNPRTMSGDTFVAPSIILSDKPSLTKRKIISKRPIRQVRCKNK